MISEKTIKIIEQGLNERLKELETYEELKEFEEEYLYLEDLELQLFLEMKRSGYTVGGFFETANPKRVEYIIEDGISEGKSLVKNLNRNMKVVFSHHV